MYGTYSYLGSNKSVPYQYLHQSFPTQHQYQHQPTPPALMQRQRRSWKTKTAVVASPPNLMIPERPHSDRYLFPRYKHSSGYPVVFPRSKSVSGTRIHLRDIKVPLSSSSSPICHQDPLVTTSKIPLVVSSMSNSKKKSYYARNTSPASCAISAQHVSSPPNQEQQDTKTLADNHLHQKQPALSSSPGQQYSHHQRKKYHQQDRHRFSAPLDTHPVPPYRRFSHPENYGSQPTGSGAGQLYHYPYYRHNHHHQQQRHQQQQYYQLTPSAYVYPPLSMTGYPPHGIYPPPNQHHSYYQPYQGQNHHHHYPTPYDIQTSTDSTIMDDDDDNDKQQRRISTNTNTDTTSTMSSSDLTPRRFSSGSTGSSSKSTLASSMGSIGIWNNDSTSSSTSTKTTTTTVTTPAISSAAATAVTTMTAAVKVDGSVHTLEQSPTDQCNSSKMTHDPAATTDDDAQTADENNGSATLATTLKPEASNGTLTTGNDSTTACSIANSNKDNSDPMGDSSSQTGNSQAEQPHRCPSTSSSSSSSTSTEPVSPHISTTTITSECSSPSASSAQPNSSTMTLPIWADPVKVHDNPTRYKVIQDYMAQHKLSYTSSLPLPKDIVFYFGDTKTTMMNYRSSMQKIFSSSTVWSFSSCWRRYKEYSGRKPSEMAVNQNLYCFQKGVEPMWEDKVNKDGGRLILCPGKQISLDDLFDWLLCAFVGGQLVDDGMVGLVLSRRARLDRIELWLDATSSTKLDSISSIRDKLLDILPGALREPVGSSHYKKHYDQ
ncbi:hypothetical protein BCR42DRAFT_493311 [Absidia repens]|uniref:Translation initiation factor eIF 4e-like domain-containing protein n=1 Tax=Absidia repens TaxID=90262 RepID=A0A1X2IBC7_9FUNG|nr:hypothetical protein BCR42DRAFT_493311 [Absidia repens]